MAKKRRKILIYTDLDGTLLHYHTYSFQEALCALAEIKKRNIPLILCSSKTKGELEEYQRKLRIKYPFISENGGAIFIPKGYFSNPKNELKVKGKYLVLELGTPYKELRKKLLEVSRKFGVKVVGFGDLKTKQIVSMFNLPYKEARLAKKRGYDEPFYFLDKIEPKEIGAIEREFKRSGLNLTKGGRFYHLLGQNDKGKAVRLLTGMYKQNWSTDFVTVGIGDSLNDLPMLKTVDIPVLVRQKDSAYDKEILKRLKVQKARGNGPSGWNQAILDLVGKYC
ncbi:MAG: HAD-IIB family hydrolase [candidate division Zixibacteria bacterium]|nr:HAD-IIB family hydrolase [candidate division Zixibacteria bacterium]MCK4428601.1 HAD-IIB family hydrolase [candidate division Zixibacteria bacterium]